MAKRKEDAMGLLIADVKRRYGLRKYSESDILAWIAIQFRSMEEQIKGMDGLRVVDAIDKVKKKAPKARKK